MWCASSYYHRAVRRLVFFPEELLDKAFSRRDPLIPPRWMIFVGPGDFIAIGKEFLRHFMELAGLKPSDDVLDVGCGIGRLAIPLTTFLDDRGSYEGFDIVPDGIAWCQNQISPRFPHFRFTLADVYNGVYNPRGRYEASEYVFPYPDTSFDFVFLASVFTHMMPGDMENYLRQVVRVLKPDGRCFITYFLITPEVQALVERGVSTLPMREQPGGYSTIDRGTPEYDIAFPESAILALYGEVGLELTAPIQYGTWCGRATGLTYQDVLVAHKLAA
jgi:SAM-dependent methyltransferase